MSDPRTTKHWVIKVNGSTKVDVGPGENVEIGRRPLRPLADDGHRRLEIDDDTRSMSKRHAVFTVAANGGASVTDMNSTNGSYVVGENGLKPLTPNRDFIFPDSPMRLQFGDVPVDFVRIDVEEHSVDDNPVTDLFDYALDGGENADIEPDMADMSVDDILNLRAGEPTMAFSAADVASRLGASESASAQSGLDSQKSNGATTGDAKNNVEQAPGEAPLPNNGSDGRRIRNGQNDHAIDQISLNVMAPQTSPVDVQARDLFKDALQSEAAEKAAGTDAGQGNISAEQSLAAGQGNGQPSAGFVDASRNVSSQSNQNQSQQGMQQVSLPTRLGDEHNPSKVSAEHRPVDRQAGTQPAVNGNDGEASQMRSQQAVLGPQTMAGQQTAQTQQATMPQEQGVQSQQQPEAHQQAMPMPQSSSQQAASQQAVMAQPTSVKQTASQRTEPQQAMRQQRQSQESVPQQTQTQQTNQQVGVTAGQQAPARYVAPRQTDQAGNRSNAFSGSFQASGDQNEAVFVPMNANPQQSAGGGARGKTPFVNSQNGRTTAQVSEERNKFMPPVQVDTSATQISEPTISDGGAIDATQTFKPVFEAGSVFEKVSNGEFDQPQPEVQVEGMNSEEAKRTTDFGVQFEMAKHPELLPFLAMNPSLYDDLYAWLSAVGNDDIDAALSQNSGYLEYRSEVGEGRKQ
ncbi:FHA domain-containing protein [Bifidobacterium sp. ESL0745]|uniref:FHA domain-containing protein n=1 Tax=Bifidobacterium sp. ESL0745 TaxID=2983226 RepID=UPI0023F9E219|nr:FHA domain-containing protein [Bifidobacterium sp. ESL0745]